MINLLFWYICYTKHMSISPNPFFTLEVRREPRRPMISLKKMKEAPKEGFSDYASCGRQPTPYWGLLAVTSGTTVT